MEQRISHRWTPIEDLPAGYEEFNDPQLHSLVSVWEEQRAELEDSEALREFNQQLLRQWAIETGIIERIYTLDRGVTQLLIERGLDAALIPHGATDKNPEVVIEIIRDQHQVVEGLFDFITKRRRLTPGYIKELHAALTIHQPTTQAVDQFGNLMEVPLRRGEYKLTPNNPRRADGSVHQYCPPEQVAGEVERLCDLHDHHTQAAVSPEIEAAWLHHRFTQIHPFQDGNGRVARALATLVVLRAGWLPLVITSDARATYLDALETADAGDLGPLVSMFAKTERRAFLQALSIARDVLARGRQVNQIVAAVRESLRTRSKSLKDSWANAFDLANALRHDAATRLHDLSRELGREIAPLAPPGSPYRFYLTTFGGENGKKEWFRYQVYETARALHYFANTSTHHSWLRLVLQTETRSEILVSFHGIGREFQGLLVTSACYFRREATGERGAGVVRVTPLTDEPFSINYRETLPEITERFQRWLDSAVVTGLEMWRRQV